MLTRCCDSQFPNETQEENASCKQGTIRKIVCSAIIAFGLAFGTAFPLAAGDKNAAASLNGFKPVKPEAAKMISDWVNNLVPPFIANHLGAAEGRPTLDISIKLHGDTLVFDLTMGGYTDDSVAGEHFRGIIKESASGWELVDLGVKYICYRGQGKSGRCT